MPICPTCDIEMGFYMPDSESWETANAPVRCPTCLQTSTVPVDTTNVDAMRYIGQVMADLVQAKRDQHHADHDAGQHADSPLPGVCHYCRDAAC